MKLPARIILICCLLLLASTLSPKSAFAQSQPYAPNPYLAPVTNPDVPHNLHSYTQNIMIEVMSAMTCQLVGIDPSNLKQKCLGVDQTTGKIGFIEHGGGAIGVMSTMIAKLYTPPLHTSDYLAYLADNFGLVKPVHAQGIGYTGLSPLIRVWSAFRNIVYLLFVIVFTVIGLLIMFRVKIDPRTVMSIGNTIPKIIVGVIMVTFSFAIAGFLIDMMWVVTYLVVNILSGVPVQPIHVDKVQEQFYTPPPGFVNELYANPNIGSFSFGGFLNIASAGARGMQSIISRLFAPNDLLTAMFGQWGEVSSQCNRWYDPTCWGEFFSKIVGGTIGGLLTHVFGWVISWVVGIIAFLVIIIALFWALFRLWFHLIIAYISILLDVVLAPFWIVFGIFPGSQISFSSWLRDLVANLSAFPTTIAMFMLGKVFMDAFTAADKSTLFNPPLIGNPNDTDALAALIGLGIILMTPQVVNMIKEILKAPQLKYGAAIGQAVGVGTGAPGAIFERAGHIGLSVTGLRNIPGLRDLPGIRERTPPTASGAHAGGV